MTGSVICYVREFQGFKGVCLVTNKEKNEEEKLDKENFEHKVKPSR